SRPDRLLSGPAAARRGAAALLVLALLAACSTVPVTERRRILWLPQDVELQMGADAWRTALQDAPVVPDGPKAEMVQRVGGKLAEVARQHPAFGDIARSFDWEFVLIDAPDTVNAWALPGGKSAVYT